MFDIIGKRFWFFLISGVVLLVSIISLATFGLKTGIEFSSGSVMTVGFEQKVKQGKLKETLAGLDYPNVIIQRIGSGDFLIRFQISHNKIIKIGLNIRKVQCRNCRYYKITWDQLSHA